MRYAMPLMDTILAILLWLAPYDPPSRLEERARVIARATGNAEEQAILIAVDFCETTFGRRGIPFGVTEGYAARQRAIQEARRNHTTVPPAYTADDGARSILNIIRRFGPWCQRPRQSREMHWARVLGFFHSGDYCRADPYSASESRLVSRILQRMRRWEEAHPGC